MATKITKIIPTSEEDLVRICGGFSSEAINTAAARIQVRLGLPVREVTGPELADLMRRDIQFEQGEPDGY